MQKNDYLTEKKPLYALIIFALPIIIGNLFQQAYTMADSIIAGKYISNIALSAVGEAYSLTNIFICIAIGSGIGSSVIIGQYFGAKEYGKMKTGIYTALIIFLMLSVILGLFGWIFSNPIMQLFIRPDSPQKQEILSMSVDYLKIYFLSLPFLFMYNVLSAMFNALGKSKIPLCLLIFSSLFNIWLDWLLATKMPFLGVKGVAWATFIAQGISSIISLIVLLFMLRKFVTVKTKIIDFKEVAPMFRIALPSILQQSTVSIGMLLVQSVVNSFSPAKIAGFTSAMRIESICVVPMSGIGNALSAFTAQNIGANKKERVKEGYRVSNYLVIFCAIIILIVLETLNEPIIKIFLNENELVSETIDTGCRYLKYMGFFFCLIGFKMTADSVLRGSGDMIIFTIANLANLFLRVAVAQIFAPIFDIIDIVWYVVPVGWFINWLISFIRYKTDKWQKISTITQEN